MIIATIDWIGIGRVTILIIVGWIALSFIIGKLFPGFNRLLGLDEEDPP